MLKVFLVEDEIIIREGIKKNIDWASEGLELVGDAGNGEDALALIRQKKPDILITDIKIPKMNGLELSKIVKKELPRIKIIIISGYDEFDYAKEAISIGVAEYMLKPVGSVELLEKIVEISSEIQEEQLRTKSEQAHIIEDDSYIKIKRSMVFSNLVSGKIDQDEMLKQCEECNINLTAGYYNILLCNVFEDRIEEIPQTFDNGSRVMQEIIVKNEKKTDIAVFDRNKEGIAFLVIGNNLEEINKSIEKLVNEIKTMCYNLIDINYFIGIGKPVEHLNLLDLSFFEANKAYALQHIVEKNQVMHFDKIKDYRIIKESGINFSEIDILKVDRAQLDAFIRTGTQRGVKKFIRDYIQNFGENNLKSIMCCQYIELEIYICCINLIEEMGYDYKEVWGDYINTQYNVSTYTSRTEFIKNLEKLIITVIEFREKNAKNKYAKLISDAKRYINKAYSNKDFSLKSVASEVNLSACHFSVIFRQVTGQNFIDYLTEIRINKAKELLRCTSKKNREIGVEVGFKDTHYFNVLFKKTEGCTPKEYRMKSL